MSENLGDGERDDAKNAPLVDRIDSLAQELGRDRREQDGKIHRLEEGLGELGSTIRDLGGQIEKLQKQPAVSHSSWKPTAVVIAVLSVVGTTMFTVMMNQASSVEERARDSRAQLQAALSDNIASLDAKITGGLRDLKDTSTNLQKEIASLSSLERSVAAFQGMTDSLRSSVDDSRESSKSLQAAVEGLQSELRRMASHPRALFDREHVDSELEDIRWALTQVEQLYDYGFRRVYYSLDPQQRLLLEEVATALVFEGVSVTEASHQGDWMRDASERIRKIEGSGQKEEFYRSIQSQMGIRLRRQLTEKYDERGAKTEAVRNVLGR